jgi:phosphate transport system substrate-binding protein
VRWVRAAEIVAATLFLSVCLGQGLVLAWPGDGDQAPTVSSPTPTIMTADAPLEIAGSGSNLPLVERVVAAWQAEQPGVRVRVHPSIGSGGAIRALRDGAIDVGFVSRPLQPGEAWDESGNELVVDWYAEVPVVAAGNPGVPVASLDAGELLAIVDGRRQRWPDGSPIVFVAREPSDSSLAAAESRHPALGRALRAAFAAERFTTVYSDAALLDALERIPGSVGLTDLGQARLRGTVRVLGQLGTKPLGAVVRSGERRGGPAELLQRLRRPATRATAEAAGYRVLP